MEDTYIKADERLAKLLGIIKKLRSENGCLWDRRQKKEDMARYILEETYELVDAIVSNRPADLKEEMGDLLFQILFLACIAEEAEEFRVDDVMATVAEKMIRRHPHVFGDRKVANVDEIKHNWEEIKKNVEKRDKVTDGILGNIPRSMPALMRAQKMTEAASKVGFDWENKDDVLEKLDEELGEFKASLTSGKRPHVKEEIGDLLLSLVNIARFVNVSAEEALTASLEKFKKRFRYIESKLAEKGKEPGSTSLKEMDDLWNESKLKE